MVHPYNRILYSAIKRNKTTVTQNNLCESQRIRLSSKSSHSIGFHLQNVLKMIKLYRRQKDQWGQLCVWHKGNLCGDRICVLLLKWLYKSTWMLKWHSTIRIKWTNVNCWVDIVHHVLLSNHWRKVKGTRDLSLFFEIFYESIITFKQLKFFKTLFPKNVLPML